MEFMTRMRGRRRERQLDAWLESRRYCFLQNDFDIANQAGASFRSDINSALQSLATNSSGATGPATTYAYQLWADTTTGLLKIRNAANSAWITVGTLASVNLGLLALSGGTLTGDITMSGASVIEAEGAAVASASSCNIWATDGNTVHITGATTINDFATAPQAGAWMKVIFDGALTLTQSANLDLNAGGENITTAAGDVALVYADTATQIDVFLIRKSGQANAVSLTTVTNALGADVALNNTASYFSGPAVAQGTSGTWFFSGTITVEDTGAAAIFDVRLTDGTTIIASTSGLLSAANNPLSITLSGYLANPVGNVAFQVKDRTNTTGFLRFNKSGNSKDCTLSAVRIA